MSPKSKVDTRTRQKKIGMHKEVNNSNYKSLNSYKAQALMRSDHLCFPTWRLKVSRISASPHTCLPGGWGACWMWEPWPTLHQKLSRVSEARWCRFWESELSLSTLRSRRCCSSIKINTQVRAGLSERYEPQVTVCRTMVCHRERFLVLCCT